MGTNRILLFGVIVALLAGVATHQMSHQQQLERAHAQSSVVIEQVYLRALREYYQYLYDVRHQQQQNLSGRQIPTGAITPYLSNHVALVDVDQWLARQASSSSPYSLLELQLSDLQGRVWPDSSLSAEIRLLIALENGEGYQQFWSLHDWLTRLFQDVGLTEPQFRIEPLGRLSGAPAFQRPIVFPDFLLPQLQLVVEQQTLVSRYYQSSLPWLWAAVVVLVLLLFCAMYLQLYRTRGHLVKRASSNDINPTQPLAALTQQERLASLGEMTSGILHEINNPLAYVNSNLTELSRDLTALMAFIAHLDEASDSLDMKSDFYQRLLAQYQALDIQHVLEEAPHRLSDCRTGIQRIQSIIDDMRRIGRQVAEKSLQLLNPSIESAINIARNKLPNNVQLQVTLTETPPMYCNASQIAQVVVNLLVNAIQALKDGGHIWLEQTLTEDWLCISIRDDGPGMSEDIVARIFDPFFTTKPDTEGSGLGLSICKKIIQQHNGRIELETAVGNGTRFDVYLPLTAEHELQEVGDAQ